MVYYALKEKYTKKYYFNVNIENLLYKQCQIFGEKK